MATVSLTSAAVDGYNQDIVISGALEGEAFFDGFEIRSEGGDDIFLAKYTREGNCIWVTSAGGTSSDYSMAVTMDSKSNIIMCGYTSGTPTFDEEELKVGQKQKMFIAKYNNSGEAIWVKTSNQDAGSEANSLVADSKGNLYVAGTFSNKLSIDKGETINAAGKKDIFIMKLNTKGKGIWMKRIGGKDNERVGSICLDSEGNLLLVGNQQVSELTSEVAFLSKFNPSGDLIWKKQIGNAKVESHGKSVASNHNLVAVGGVSIIKVPDNYETPIRFEPYVQVFDRNGELQWQRNISSEKSCFLSSIQFDGSGNLNVTGSYIEMLNFKEGNKLRSQGEDVYLVQFNNKGNLNWARNGKSTGLSEGTLSCSLGSSESILAGHFENTISLGKVSLSAPRGQAYAYFSLFSKEGDFEWGQSIRMEKGSSSSKKKVNYFAKLLLEQDEDMRFLENRVVTLNGTDGSTVMVTRTDERGDFAFRQIDPEEIYNVDIDSERDSIIGDLHLATRAGVRVSKLERKSDGTPTYSITPDNLAGFESSRIFQPVDYEQTIDGFMASSEKRISIAESVSFDSDSIQLSDETKESLKYLSKILRKRLDLDLEIISHTDARLDEKRSLEESQKMANTIAEYLNKSRKIQMVRLRPIGKGSAEIRNRCKPGVYCSEKEHSYNRRTEFVFIKLN